MGEASEAPDTFRAQLTVACQRADVSSALDAMAEAMSRVAASLRGLGYRTSISKPPDCASIQVQAEMRRPWWVIEHRRSWR